MFGGHTVDFYFEFLPAKSIEESISILHFFPPNRGVDFILNFFFPPNRGVDFYFEFLRAKSRGRFYFEFLPAKIHREEAPADDR
jgi:hypothetical protein